MPVNYDYDPKLNAVIVHLKGTVKKVEVLDYQDRIFADAAVQHGYFEIVDFSTTNDYSVSEEDLAEIALNGERGWLRRKATSARTTTPTTAKPMVSRRRFRLSAMTTASTSRSTGIGRTWSE